MIRNVFHFCIIFPGLLFFSVWPLQMEVIMHRGRCVFKKKDWIQLPYPSTFPNTPCFLWGRGFVVTLPNRDVAPSPRQDLREARSRVYSTQLTRSIWSYCFGGHADCNVCRVAESWALAVSWLLRLWTLSLCLSLRALISNCPWGTLITLLNPSAATRLTTHLFCSFFLGFQSSANQISRVVSATVQSSLVSFLLYKHQSQFECTWLNHMNNLDWDSDHFQVSICFIFMVIHNFHAFPSFVAFLLYNVDNESMKNQVVYQNWSFNYSI